MEYSRARSTRLWILAALIHQLSCSQHHAQRIEMPKPDKEGNPPTMRFKNIEHQLPAPFTIYADLECILWPYDTTSPNPSTSSTTPHNKHIACGAAYYIVSTDKRFHREPTVLRGENVMSEFIERLISDVAQLKQYLRNIVKMKPLSAEQRTEFDSATTCHICRRVFMESDRRVRDHDHITGAYRGAAHASCNLNYRLHVSKTKITVFIHNLRNYDAHLILSAAKPEHGPITVIPNNTERYIWYQIGDIIFKHSCQFMPSSLSTLTSNLQPSDFIHTKLHLTIFIIFLIFIPPHLHPTTWMTMRRRIPLVFLILSHHQDQMTIPSCSRSTILPITETRRFSNLNRTH